MQCTESSEKFNFQLTFKEISVEAKQNIQRTYWPRPTQNVFRIPGTFRRGGSFFWSRSSTESSIPLNVFEKCYSRWNPSTAFTIASAFSGAITSASPPHKFQVKSQLEARALPKQNGTLAQIVWATHQVLKLGYQLKKSSPIVSKPLISSKIWDKDLKCKFTK